MEETFNLQFIKLNILIVYYGMNSKNVIKKCTTTAAYDL